MAIEKTQVKVELTGDEKAIADAQRVERAMNRVKREAKQAQAAVDKARSGGSGLRRRGGLLGRLSNRAGVRWGDEDVQFGAFKVGRGGFGLREEFVKGRTGSAAGAGLRMGFVAMVAGQALGRTLEQLADLKDLTKEYKNRQDELRELLLTSGSKKVFDAFGTKSTLRGGYRLLGGNKEAFDNALQLAYGETSDVELAIDAQAAGRRAFFKMMEKRQDLEDKRREAVDKANAKVDEIIERQLAGFKTDIFRPKGIRLAREQNQAAQRLYDDARRRRVMREGAAAKSANQQVLAGEGR